MGNDDIQPNEDNALRNKGEMETINVKGNKQTAAHICVVLSTIVRVAWTETPKNQFYSLKKIIYTFIQG